MTNENRVPMPDLAQYNTDGEPTPVRGDYVTQIAANLATRAAVSSGAEDDPAS